MFSLKYVIFAMVSAKKNSKNNKIVGGIFYSKYIKVYCTTRVDKIFLSHKLKHDAKGGKR